MDAGAERPLHDWTGNAVGDMKHELRPYGTLKGSVLPYPAVADFYRAQTGAKDFTWFRSVVPMWDNTARYGAEAILLHGSTPQKFQDWTESAIAHAREHLPEDRRFMVINAWNEWAEGAHLEPDSRHGYAYLNAIGRALSGIPYAAALNPEPGIPGNLRIRLSLPEPVLSPCAPTRNSAGASCTAWPSPPCSPGAP